MNQHKFLPHRRESHRRTFLLSWIIDLKLFWFRRVAIFRLCRLFIVSALCNFHWEEFQKIKINTRLQMKSPTPLPPFSAPHISLSLLFSRHECFIISFFFYVRLFSLNIWFFFSFSPPHIYENPIKNQFEPIANSNPLWIRSCIPNYPNYSTPYRNCPIVKSQLIIDPCAHAVPCPAPVLRPSPLLHSSNTVLTKMFNENFIFQKTNRIKSNENRCPSMIWI